MYLSFVFLAENKTRHGNICNTGEALAVKYNQLCLFVVCDTSGFNLLHRLPAMIKEGCQGLPYQWL